MHADGGGGPAGLLSRLSEGLAGLAAWIFFAIGLMLTFEVVARYFFNAPTIWAEELSRLLQVWGTWLAAAWLLWNRQLIAVGVVWQRLPFAAKRFASFVNLLLIAAFCAVAIGYGTSIVLDSLRFGRKSATMLDLPLWLGEIAVPLGCALVLLECLRELVRLVRDPRALFEPSPDTPE